MTWKPSYRIGGPKKPLDWSIFMIGLMRSEEIAWLKDEEVSVGHREKLREACLSRFFSGSLCLQRSGFSLLLPMGKAPVTWGFCNLTQGRGQSNLPALAFFPDSFSLKYSICDIELKVPYFGANCPEPLVTTRLFNQALLPRTQSTFQFEADLVTLFSWFDHCSYHDQ